VFGRHIARNSLKVHKFHGRNREEIPSRLRDFDVVLTTYSTLVKDYSQGAGVLFHLLWFRVILDEGMVIFSNVFETTYDSQD
jgi:SNF2 family DNA or RNA helicase